MQNIKVERDNFIDLTKQEPSIFIELEIGEAAPDCLPIRAANSGPYRPSEEALHKAAMDTKARVIPMYPPWPQKVCHCGKTVENRGTNLKATRTAVARARGLLYLGETKTVDPAFKGQSDLRLSSLPSALVACVEVVAVLDNFNPAHVEALKSCPATCAWFSPGGNKKCSIVFSRVVELAKHIPYDGKQGYHFLPIDVPPAAQHFTSGHITRLLTLEQEAVFAALGNDDHRDLKSLKRKRESDGM